MEFTLHKRTHRERLPDETVEEIVKLDSLNGNDDHKKPPDGYCSKSDCMLLAKQNGVVCGKLEFSFVNDYKACYISWICAPGCGSALVAKFENLMKGQSVSEIQLMVSVDPDERQEVVL